jgi:hypothetical protein
MPERPSWAVSAAGGLISSEDARVSMGGLCQPGGVLVSDSRSGWLPVGLGTNAPGAVTANGTPNNSVNVAPFMRIHQSTRGKGPYIMCLDVSKSINILSTPAHATNPRNDLIVAQQSDAFYGDGNSLMVIRHVVGTPAASPVDPVVTGSPDYALLARVVVPANDTTIEQGQITDLRSTALTVAIGGTIPVVSQTERNAITSPFTGMMIYRTDRLWREVYTGTGWRVLDTAIVTAFADLATHITNPFEGQLAFVTADDAFAIYSGSAWVYQLQTANTQNLCRYKQNAAHAVAHNTDTKARFQASVSTTPDVTVSGTGNTDFTLNRSGRWRIETSVRYAASASLLERHVFICTSGNLVTPRFCEQQIAQTANAPASLAVSTTKRFAAATAISVGLFQNSGVSINTDPVFDEVFSISLTWEGP